MSDPGSVTVELFGIPRQRAGCAELMLPAGTIAEVLKALESACPALTVFEGDRLAPHLLLSVNGQQFVSDLGWALRPGDRLLLLTADVGG